MSPAGRKILYYVDPMHPAYKSDKPGIAPDCGMELVPVYADGTMGGSGEVAVAAPGTVNVSPEKQQLIGIRIGQVETRIRDRDAPTAWPSHGGRDPGVPLDSRGRRVDPGSYLGNAWKPCGKGTSAWPPSTPPRFSAAQQALFLRAQHAGPLPGRRAGECGTA